VAVVVGGAVRTYSHSGMRAISERGNGMDLVWEVEYQRAAPGVRVDVVSAIGGAGAGSMSGITVDPTVVALACAAFTHRFWVHMTTDMKGKITGLNVLPDGSLPPWTPAPVSAGLGIASIALEPPVSEQWPDVVVEFADGQRAADMSKQGFVEPIVRAGLVSGEGVFDLELVGGTIHRVRLTHELQRRAITDLRSPVGATANQTAS